MTIVADQSTLTQQYRPYLKPANDQASGHSTSTYILGDNFTIRNSEYVEIISSNPQLPQKETKNVQLIEIEVNEITFLGSLNTESYDNLLTASEVSSMSMLRASYKKEVKRLKGKSQNLIESSNHIFSLLSNHLFKLPFDNCSVEINSDESMKFTLSFTNNKLLMITKSNDFEELRDLKDQIIYSFFINRKLIASDVTTIGKFVKGFKEYISI